MILKTWILVHRWRRRLGRGTSQHSGSYSRESGSTESRSRESWSRESRSRESWGREYAKIRDPWKMEEIKEGIEGLKKAIKDIKKEIGGNWRDHRRNQRYQERNRRDQGWFISPLGRSCSRTTSSVIQTNNFNYREYNTNNRAPFNDKNNSGERPKKAKKAKQWGEAHQELRLITAEVIRKK